MVATRGGRGDELLSNFYRPALGRRLTTSNNGPRKLGPTSGVGQCLARHVNQGAEEWSNIDHQDVLMCPRQCRQVGSVTRTTELGHERWIPDHTPVIS